MSQRNNSNKKSTNVRIIQQGSAAPKGFVIVEERKVKRRKKLKNNKPRQTQEIGIAIGRGVRVSQPKVASSQNGTRIIHREFIGNVQSPSAGFHQILRYRFNACSETTFPWLSSLAGSFETYRFRRLRFDFVARCPTTTAGSIIASPDYDAQDGVPMTEAIMTQQKDTVEDSPWKNFSCVISPSSMNRTYKAHFTMDDVRFAATGQDEKTIDAGQLFVATNCDGTVNLAKLWVDYDVDLFTPQPVVLNTATGGVGMGGLGITPNAGQNPITGMPTTVNQDVVNPVLSMVGAGNVIGNFTRDWKGFVDIGVTGTGIPASIGGPTLDGVGAQPVSIATTVNSAGTFGVKQAFINAAAGQALGWTGLNPTTIANIALNLGASNFI